MKYAVICTSRWEVLDYIESTSYDNAYRSAKKVFGEHVTVVLSEEDLTL